jgi:hypothetical protein
MNKLYNVVTVKLNQTIEGLQDTKESPLYSFDLEMNKTRLQNGFFVVTDNNNNIVFMAKLINIEYIHTEFVVD